MKKREIGKSSIFVSPMGMGTTKFGRIEGVHYPKSFSLPEDKKIAKLLDIASEQGVNLLDTAPAYGTSEEKIGKLLKNKRKNWIISTKVGESFVRGKSFYDFSRLAIQKSLQQSMKMLQTDYLDIVLLHSDGNDLSILDSLDYLKKAKEKGMIRLFGMSSKTVEGGIKALEQSDLGMIYYNLDYQKEVSVIRFAQQQKKGIFIKKALQSGHLVGKDKFKQNIDFILQESAVSSIIIGTIDQKHLQENISFFKE